MPALARDFELITVDQRGIGLSDKPQDAYDTGTLARDLVALMDALGHQRFAMYGTDTGMPIAYAVAADHPDRLDRLIVSEAPIPGVSPSPPLFVPPQLNAKFWHLMFNQLPKVEQLVTGREDIFFGAEFDASAGKNKLPDDAVKYYIDILRSDPDALRGSFGFYRAHYYPGRGRCRRRARPDPNRRHNRQLRYDAAANRTGRRRLVHCGHLERYRHRRQRTETGDYPVRRRVRPRPRRQQQQRALQRRGGACPR
jgi:pimeloyl-ACP methyl ester carboxylesterase